MISYAKDRVLGNRSPSEYSVQVKEDYSQT